jgi:hypothetical protein
LLRPTGYLPSFFDSLVEKGLLELEFLFGRDGVGHPSRPSFPLPRMDK